MNGLEFARCTTAGGFGRVLIHAAPADAKIEIIDGDDAVVARADLQRTGDYSPMTLIELDGSAMRRSEVWPDAGLYGLPVLLAGGEVGILRRWRHAEDRSWWRRSGRGPGHRRAAGRRRRHGGHHRDGRDGAGLGARPPGGARPR
jgi:hypothetical protein